MSDSELLDRNAIVEYLDELALPDDERDFTDESIDSGQAVIFEHLSQIIPHTLWSMYGEQIITYLDLKIEAEDQAAEQGELSKKADSIIEKMAETELLRSSDGETRSKYLAKKVIEDINLLASTIDSKNLE